MAPKVTIHHEPRNDTPSQAIINGSNTVQVITDEKGRKIGIRKLKALERLRMFEVLGPENAKNQMYLGYAALAFQVCSIDEEKINRPGTKMALEALIQQLGDEGIDAIGEAIEAEMKKKENIPETEAVEQIKN